jgi:beta-xylosidase
MRGRNAYVERSVDLTGMTDVHLKFYAKAYSFESADTMRCLVSSDYVDWKVVHTWVNGDDDNTYHPFDIDLSSFDMSSKFWIAFDSGMSSNSDYFYVDYLSIVGMDNS